MLRYKEKENIDARFTEVDRIVEEWRERDRRAGGDLRNEFRTKLIISLIYHDAALEGDVLSHSEIKAAIDKNIISDPSLIPSYDEIKSFYDACRYAFDVAKQKRKALKLDVVKEVYGRLNTEAGPNGSAYRKDNPLHRLYYHEISPPEKIAYRMRKYGEWLDGDQAKTLHPIERAAHTHWKLMAIFPWSKHSGRTARIVANLILERADYPLAVIHSIDRQRYYESLRSSDLSRLLSVYLEAVETTAAAALRVYDEAERGRRRRAS